MIAPQAQPRLNLLLPGVDIFLELPRQKLPHLRIEPVHIRGQRQHHQQQDDQNRHRSNAHRPALPARAGPLLRRCCAWLRARSVSAVKLQESVLPQGRLFLSSHLPVRLVILARQMQQPCSTRILISSCSGCACSSASRAAVSTEMARSPAIAAFPFTGAAGNDSTSVALSFCRNSRFSRRICSSPVSSTETCPASPEASDACLSEIRNVPLPQAAAEFLLVSQVRSESWPVSRPWRRLDARKAKWEGAMALLLRWYSQWTFAARLNRSY